MAESTSSVQLLRTNFFSFEIFGFLIQFIAHPCFLGVNPLSDFIHFPCLNDCKGQLSRKIELFRREFLGTFQDEAHQG